MTPVDEQLLQRMTTAIVEVADPEQIILFGSHARGAGGTTSDIDLVVVEAEPFGPGRDRGAKETRLWRALAKFHISKDILVYSREEVDYWRNSLNHVLARALREGKVLYERPLASQDTRESGGEGRVGASRNGRPMISRPSQPTNLTATGSLPCGKR